MKLIELKQYFSKLNLTLWNNTKIDNWVIEIADKFVNGHISTLEANTGNAEYVPYYNRLIKFYNLTKS